MEGKIYQTHSLKWEMSNFIKVWISVVVSLFFCKVANKFVPQGLTRLLTFVPVVCLFLYLPLNLHSVHFVGMTSFFIAWLANFKILLLAFDKGPLSDPTLSLPQFIAIACFPIGKTQQTPPLKTNSKQNPLSQSSKKPHKSLQYYTSKILLVTHKSLHNYTSKILLVILFWRIYEYDEVIPPKIIMMIFGVHMYFMLELMLVVIAALAQSTLALELDPQFNEPYLSTSLQDFWGRRWNIMVSRTLRPTVYDPTLIISTRIMGRKRAFIPAVLCTFVVSALMHELIFYYMGREQPNWEMSSFFILHGVSLVIEIEIKKTLKGRFQLPRLISTPLTIGYVMITGFWLFFPEIYRVKVDVRSLEEYALVGAFLKDVFKRALMSRNFDVATITN